MPDTKKIHWLKLKTDFFNQREVKKLRRVAGGDTYTIIYLKLQLLSAKNDGIINFEGTEKSLAEQLELELDEELENIKITLSFLQANGLIESINDSDFLMPKVCDCIGKEGSSAARVRKHRDSKMLQCNNTVTICNTEKEKEKEKEKERREEIDKEKEEKINKKEIVIEAEILQEKPLEERTIDYLNRLTGKNFTYTKGNLKEIKSQIKKGATQEQLKYVIDVKVNEWINNDEMKKHLNPVTLFRDSNFERYLNQDFQLKGAVLDEYIRQRCEENING